MKIPQLKTTRPSFQGMTPTRKLFIAGWPCYPNPKQPIRLTVIAALLATLLPALSLASPGKPKDMDRYRYVAKSLSQAKPKCLSIPDRITGEDCDTSSTISGEYGYQALKNYDDLCKQVRENPSNTQEQQIKALSQLQVEFSPLVTEADGTISPTYIYNATRYGLCFGLLGEKNDHGDVPISQAKQALHSYGFNDEQIGRVLFALTNQKEDVIPASTITAITVAADGSQVDRKGQLTWLNPNGQVSAEEQLLILLLIAQYPEAMKGHLESLSETLQLPTANQRIYTEYLKFTPPTAPSTEARRKK